jgi:hypothetical protein
VVPFGCNETQSKIFIGWGSNDAVVRQKFQECIKILRIDIGTDTDRASVQYFNLDLAAEFDQGSFDRVD